MQRLTKCAKNKLCIKLVFFLHDYIEILHDQENIKYIFFSLHDYIKMLHGQQNTKYISVLVLSTCHIVIPNIQNFNIKNLSLITAS